MPQSFFEAAKHWQLEWKKAKLFEAKDGGKKPFYVLEMYPYPSGKMHMGHVRNYSLGDALARFKRMQGFNVLYPMGFDSFGLPAENAAIKQGVSPKEWTEKNIASMRAGQESMGYSYDWSRTVSSHDPNYYRWNQWIFLQMLKRGLAYRKKALGNWCSTDQTVLANEQVIDGKCWRCHNPVTKKELDQWFFKITDYAEELLQDLKKLGDWPERVRVMQENWIGKSDGALIDFKVDGSNETIQVFTTRIDTIFGVSFIVLAPEHPIVQKLAKGKFLEMNVKAYVQSVSQKQEFERISEGKSKTGLFLEHYAINPFNQEKVPIFVSEFVLPNYATGAIMGVPAHDQRDFEFAKEHQLAIYVVVSPDGNYVAYVRMDTGEHRYIAPEKVFAEEGILVQSDLFNGLKSAEAIPKMIAYAQKNGFGKKSTQFKLRDWLISRQRYWGTPIPIVHCPTCGVVPVPEKELPVKLPENAKFTGKGNPLESVPEFLNAKCPNCGNAARRETDTMDTFVDSSWYYWRYTDPKNELKPFDSKKAKLWMPVQQYIGGVEHAILHLLYARFFTKVLNDLKLAPMREPFQRLLTLGMVLNDGKVMSKSAGNGVEPEPIIQQYGPDTLRAFILGISAPTKELDWNSSMLENTHRWIERWNDFLLEHAAKKVGKKSKPTLESDLLESKTKKTVIDCTELIELLQYHDAFLRLQQLSNDYMKFGKNDSPEFRKGIQTIVLLSSPFAPHLSESGWKALGNKGFCSTAKWPSAKLSKKDLELETVSLLLEQVREDVRAIQSLAKLEKPKRVVLYSAPNWKWVAGKAVAKATMGKPDFGAAMKSLLAVKELQSRKREFESFVKSFLKLSHTLIERESIDEFDYLNQAKELLEKEFGFAVEIQSAEKPKSDPQNKSRNALPLKPAIWME